MKPEREAGLLREQFNARLSADDRIKLYTLLSQWSRNIELQAEKVKDLIERERQIAYRAGAEAQRERGCECIVMAPRPGKYCNDCGGRSAPIEGVMQTCQLCGGPMDEHKKRCPNHPEFIWGTRIEGESK